MAQRGLETLDVQKILKKINRSKIFLAGFLLAIFLLWQFGIGPASAYPFNAAVNFSMATNPATVIAVDLNASGGDGPDLATSNAAGNVTVLINNGSGGSLSYAAAASYTVGTAPQQVIAANFDGANGIDLATANATTNNVSVLINSGTGTFAAAANFAVGTNPNSLVSADFNSDGRPDIATANTSGRNISILTNTGTTPIYGAATTVASGQFLSNINAGSLRGNGVQDLVVTATGSLVYVFLGNNNSTFASAVSYATGGTGAGPIAIADFNADGKMDLAVSNSGSSNVSILLGTGTGTFGSATTYSTDTTPRYSSAADVNNDGKVDLVVATQTNNDVSVLLGNGTGGFAAPANTTVGTAPRAAYIADVNGDGNPDIAAANSNSANVSVLLGQFPVPTTTSISPISATKGDSGLTLTVNGTNFVSNSVVNIAGSARTTTFVSATQLTAAILSGDLTSTGTFNITVFNTTPGGGTSGAQTFTVNNPSPTTSSISPASKIAGEGSFTLTVNGSNFISSSVVKIAGTGRTTTFISDSQLTAAVLSSDISTPGAYDVTVFNPTPGGGTSGAQVLTVESPNPLPTISVIAPSMKTAGDVGFTVTVDGSNFIATSVVKWNGADRATTFVSSTQLTAEILAADILTASSNFVSVSNPAPGGGASNNEEFVVNADPYAPIDANINVSATVEPVITFSLVQNLCSLGSLSDSTVRTCSFSVDIATNATHGYTLSIKDANNGSLVSNMNEIAYATGSVSAGTPGFGVGTSQAGQDIIQNSSCADGGSAQAGRLTTSTQRIASASSPVAGDSITVCVAAAISSLTPAGSYADTVYVTAVGNF